MKLYLDTADRGDWDDLMPTGLFHGITTNPLLAARAGLSYGRIDWSAMAAQARALGAKELHAQVFGPPEGYADWSARLYAAGAANDIETVVKIPLVEPAIRATASVKALGGRILMTACYDAKQMLIADALEADFIAPYLGRMDEAGLNAMDQLRAMQAMRATGAAKCDILVASLRTPDQMTGLAAEGLSTFTIAPSIARALMANDLSAAAHADFESAAGS